MKNEQLITDIREAINQAQKGESGRKLIFEGSEISGKHEFLFFIKPEITLKSSRIDLDGILSMVFQKLEDFGLGIKNAILLPASYLDKYSIIAQHYGVINAIARDVKTNLNDSAKARFEELFKVSVAEADIYGAIQFLEKFPEFTPTALDHLWQNVPFTKLGGGAYAQALKIDGAQVYLVNGFHPRQLEHFTLKGRSIIAFTLCGDLDWESARNKLIGKTNPADAESGSIRRTLLNRIDEFGLSAVSSSWNGVHLSAGPVEGLVELIRYNSDFSASQKLSPADFAFGKELEQHFSGEAIEKILSNSLVQYNGKTESIFDLTEERDAEKAVALLKESGL